MRSEPRASVEARGPLLRSSARSVIYILLLTSVVLLLSTKGITDEGVVSLQPDSARHLMNGVFLYDLIRNLPLSHPVDYAYKYYARYPSLSIGHHSPLLGLAEVPFYAIFGISVFSARLAIVFFMLLAGIAWFLLARVAYDDTIAFFSSLLLITAPFVASFSRVVMSEVPTLALLILASYFFYQYCLRDERRYAYAFAISLVLSIYARQQTIFTIPIFLCYFLFTKGVRRLISREVLISCLIAALLLLPLVPMTLKLSQTNVRMVVTGDISSRLEPQVLLYFVRAIWNSLLTHPVLFLALTGISLSLYRKDKRVTLFLLWVVGYYLMLTFARVLSPRYGIYLIPPFCLLAAVTLDAFHRRLWRVLISMLVIVTAAYQFVFAFGLEPTRAGGYEEAAKYVLEHRKGETVLYCSNVDAGYFIFFVRKHSVRPDLIVLRADKLLVCPSVKGIVEERIGSREEIYDILRDLGTGYVVIEDTELRPRPSQSGAGGVKSSGLSVRERILSRPKSGDLQGVTVVMKETIPRPLQWLREEVDSDKFILREKIPIRSNSNELQNGALAIYEYKGHTPPDHEKTLRMNLHPMGDSLTVRLDDLL